MHEPQRTQQDTTGRMIETISLGDATDTAPGETNKSRIATSIVTLVAGFILGLLAANIL